MRRPATGSAEIASFALLLLLLPLATGCVPGVHTSRPEFRGTVIAAPATGGSAAGEFAAAAPTAGADDAFLWDIRVAPACRGGVGRALLTFAEFHARASGRRRMTVETQDIYVPACFLYAAAGYALVEVNRGAYAELPDEVQLIWRKDLA